MLSVPLLRENLRENRQSWLTFTGILGVLTLLFILAYSPEAGSRLETVFVYLPDWVRRLLDMELMDRSLNGVLSAYLYGFWFLLIPMVYTMSLSYCLVADKMESGSMIYYVGTPLGRKRVILTQGYFLVFGQFSMVTFITILGIVLSEVFFPGSLDIPQFLLLNISVFCLHFFLGGMEFFFSCLDISEGLRRFLITGLPVAAFGCYLLGNLGGVMEPFLFVSVFSVFDWGLILKGDITLFLRMPVLLAGGGVFYALALFVYRRRDLNFGCPSVTHRKHRPKKHRRKG